MARIPRTLGARPERAQPRGAQAEPAAARPMSTAGVVGIITALGTLLAGVAALIALWVPVGGNASGSGADGSSTVTGGGAGGETAPPIHDLASMVRLVRDTGNPELPGGSAYGEYATRSAAGTVDDALLTLGVQAPESWTWQIGEWLADDGEVQGGYVVAATDIDRLFENWDAPGLFFAASPRSLEPAAELDARNVNRRANCTGGADNVLSDGALDGLFRIWTGCGDGNGLTIDVVANDRRSAGSMLLTFKAAGQQDLAAFHTAVETLAFTIDDDEDDMQAPGFIVP